MDNLPIEMLCKVASNLPFDDVYSFIRTNNTIYEKLSQYQSNLPKPPVDVVLACLETNVIELSVSASYCSNYDYGRDWRVARKAVLADRPDDASGVSLRVEEIDELANFYHGFKVLLTDRSENAAHRIKIFPYVDGGQQGDYNRRKFAIGRLEGLDLHWNTIVKVTRIESLTMMRVDADVGDLLARLISSSCERIESITIDSNVSNSHLAVIAACKPRFLDINEYVGNNDEFYSLPAVHNLEWLKDDSPSYKTIPNLCALTAENMEIGGDTDITLAGVKKFINEWLQSKREIGEIKLNLDVSFEE